MAGNWDATKFKARLAKLPASVKRNVEPAIAKDAAELVQMMKAVVPKDPVDGTPLHDSITSEVTETGGQIVRAGGPETTKPSAGGDYSYARAVEFGTVEMAPQPFFWTSYRTLKRRFIARRRRALSKALKEL